ncbi:MAG: 1-deoxy-D-xylulose-5-phosphate synthase [Spirochaetia bacterium]|nr:1-deoxy-D-xylulose-5-phosphate synthase [Spirochaetia bacterium]
MKFLNNINSISDLKILKTSDLPFLCSEIRNFLINTVSQTGGHFASNLGSVELTVALHYVFNSPHDKICWDVGHQTYTHKILTGRKDKLSTIRKFKGISGFPKQEESEHDTFNTGHAGTSISQALAHLTAFKLQSKKSQHAIAVIGDASIASGVAFEALNHAGHMKLPLIVLLNDNEMSISKNVGALSYSLTSAINTRLFRKWRRRSLKFLHWLPIIGPISERLLLRFESSMKSIITEHQFFEELGFRYLGPLDGHNVKKLVKFFNKLKDPEEPVIVHLVTKKGKGYAPAEKEPTFFHGTKPFDKNTGRLLNINSKIPLSFFAANALSLLAEKDKDICALTPAMSEGSGLQTFSQTHPERFFDVGIAEQHAITFAGALAKTGLKPFLFIYSTFLQRGYDQLILDIALMNMPVRIVIDRAGCVGSDGETHQGMYDYSFLSCIPNMKLLSASSPEELMNMINYMKDFDKSPICVRFPKADFDTDIFLKWQKKYLKLNKFNPFKSEIVENGEDILIITEGIMLETGLEVKKLLKSSNISAEILSLKTIHPFDLKTIEERIKGKKGIFTIENHSLERGIGQSLFSKINIPQFKIIYHSFGYPNKFIEHGDVLSLNKKYGLNPDSIAESILKTLKNSIKPKVIKSA